MKNSKDILKYFSTILECTSTPFYKESQQDLNYFGLVMMTIVGAAQEASPVSEQHASVPEISQHRYHQLSPEELQSDTVHADSANRC